MSEPGDEPSAPPGWYPDPWGIAPVRWWNGAEWTPRTRGTFENPPEPPAELVIPPSQFWSDFKAATATCARSSGLVLVTLAIQVSPAAFSAAAHDDSVGLLSLLAALIEVGTIGFYGTQRVWLLGRFGGRDLTGSQVYRLTKDYFGRFFGLGVRIFLPLGVLIAVVAVATRNNAAILVTAAVTGYALDMLLTFVVPDLTFRANSSREAWQSGRLLLRESWPQSRWYVLTPGIALLAVSNALGGYNQNLWVVIPESAISAVLSLIFRGTILAYYLRLRPETVSQLVS